MVSTKYIHIQTDNDQIAEGITTTTTGSFATYSTGFGESFQHGIADPRLCKHEWWVDTAIVYTSYPAQYKQVCRLCGEQRFVSYPHSLPDRWQKVI